MDPSTPLQPYVPPAGTNPPPVGGPAAGIPSAPSPDPFAPAPPMSPNSFGASPPLMPASAPAPAAAANPKQEVIEQLRKANNVLITVSNNPSIDQLAAAIGITLILNKLDKHATAVYSGQTPSSLEFLQPEKTIEKNTDSLRDFIIALDKAKADKLRYKVEDKFVKIFITPYHTSLSENDLEFSQGDFNVDVVLALGVHKREELDQAITAHGRILHDAVTVSVNNHQPSDLGAINWFQADASSLSEMLVSLVEPLQGDKVILDDQIATAFLTGVVAETERFSNAKTSPFTMNISAMLMKAGANQQLVSSKLQEHNRPKADEPKLTSVANEGAAPVPTAAKDGALEIKHQKEEYSESSKSLSDLEKENKENIEEGSDLAKIHIDTDGKLIPADKVVPEQPAASPPPISGNMILQPPALGGDLSAATRQETFDTPQPSVDAPPNEMAGTHPGKTISPLSEEEKTPTLSDLERAVDSHHVSAVDELTAPVPSQGMPLESDAAPLTAEQARQAIEAANAAIEPTRLEPVEALNAQPINLEPEAPAPPAPAPEQVPETVQNDPEQAVEDTNADGDLTNDEVFPPQVVGPDQGLPPDPTAGAADPSAPPPVPPPLMPPTL